MDQSATLFSAKPAIRSNGLPFADFNYKALRAAALALPAWSEWAKAKNVNAAFVPKSLLELFMNEQFSGDVARFMAHMQGATAPQDAAPRPTNEAPAVPAPRPAPSIGQAPKAPAVSNAVQAVAKETPSTDKLAAALAEIMANSAQSAPLDHEQVKAMVAGELATQLAGALDGFQRVSITVLDKATNEQRAVEGLTHKSFPQLLKACAARDTSGNHLNVWLHGPAGSGKTHAAHQAAKALGLPFGFHGSMSMTHELTGFVDAAGTYHRTQFVKRFREGGVCLLDEVDAGENGPLLALQAALANGDMSLPNGEIIQRHKDFVCIAAGNTTGQGPNADYVGRTKIDAAFLSRFPIMISWDYDNALEQAFTGNKDFAVKVQSARARAKALGIKTLITPRHSAAGAALIAGGATPDEAAQATYLSGMTAEQARLMQGA